MFVGFAYLADSSPLLKGKPGRTLSSDPQPQATILAPQRPSGTVAKFFGSMQAAKKGRISDSLDIISWMSLVLFKWLPSNASLLGLR